MKTRVTFRLGSDLAEALRELPNQTHFVEEALRLALGRTCPVCEGSGRVSGRGVRVENLRHTAVGSLDRQMALQLKRVVSLANALAANKVDFTPGVDARALGFVVRRGSEVLLRGSLRRESAELGLS